MTDTQTASLESMSSTELKQLLAKETSAVETPVQPEVAATETPVEKPVEEVAKETPSEKKETTAEAKTGTPEAKSVKLKVEGKEIEIPEERLVEFAQKGYHYEQKMGELKRLKETVQTPATPTTTQFTPEQIKAELNKRFETVDTAVPTIIEMINAGIQNDREASKQERIADLQFEMDRTADAPHWDAIKPAYEKLRLLGEPREAAYLKAENDFFKSRYVTARQQGIDEGMKKAKLKEAADMPGKERASTPVVQPQLPSDAQLAKMSSTELAAMLPRREVED